MYLPIVVSFIVRILEKLSMPREIAVVALKLYRDSDLIALLLRI